MTTNTDPSEGDAVLSRGGDAGGQSSPLAHVLRGALALFSTQPITWTATLATTALLPRLLTDGEIGDLAVAMTVASLAGTITSLGISTPLVRGVATRPGEATADAVAAVILQGSLSTVAVLALVLAGPLLGFTTDTQVILLIALIGMVVAVPQGVLYSMLVGQQRHGRFAWTNAAITSISQIAGIAVVAAGGTLALYIAVGVGVTAVATVLGWLAFGIGFDRRGFRLARLARLAREGLPFLGGALSNRLRGDAEVMLLATLLSQQVVGWWSTAGRIVTVPLFIPTLICTPLLPALAACSNDRATFERTLRRSLVLVLMLMVPVSAGIVSVAPAIPDVLGWDARFQNSVPLMQALGFSMTLIATSTVLGTGVIVLGDERRWLIVSAVATIISIVMNLLAISAVEARFQQGAMGAAAVRAIVELVMIGGALYLLPSGTIDRVTLTAVARIALAGMCLMVVAGLLLPLSLPLSMAAGGACYVIMLFVLRIVQPSDMRTVQATALEMLVARRQPARAVRPL